jgi:hypothetical protein
MTTIKQSPSPHEDCSQSPVSYGGLRNFFSSIKTNSLRITGTNGLHGCFDDEGQVLRHAAISDGR